MKRDSSREYDRRRGNRHTRGYGHRWVRARDRFLEANPWCAICKRAGSRTPATVVDHVIPHKGDQRLFWTPSNLQSLCAACHNAKTRSDEQRKPLVGFDARGRPIDPRHHWNGT